MVKKIMTVLLKNFPYFSQLDNIHSPMGTCNVTSLAMCLWYFGIRGNGSYPQLEDQIYKKALVNNVNYQTVDGIKWLAETYPGIKDYATTKGTIDNIRDSLDKGLPVILHGYFTRSGHIIVVKGYNTKGFIVNDPFGEFFYSGYRKNDMTNPNRGEGLIYSVDLISNVCSPESRDRPCNIWMHTIKREQD